MGFLWIWAVCECIEGEHPGFTRATGLGGGGVGGGRGDGCDTTLPPQTCVTTISPKGHPHHENGVGGLRGRI